MAHFYGSVKGRAGEASRLGNEGSGITAVAASWSGAVRVSLWRDPDTGKDMYSVNLMPWRNRGVSKCIARGIVGVDPDA
jgi:hypothetical protein